MAQLCSTSEAMSTSEQIVEKLLKMRGKEPYDPRRGHHARITRNDPRLAKPTAQPN